MNPPTDSTLNRRTFLTRSTAALAATSVAGFPTILRAQAAEKPIKIALVGCGGRGSGAAEQALKADNYVQLVAMGDAFSDRLETAHKNLKAGEAGARKALRRPSRSRSSAAADAAPARRPRRSARTITCSSRRWATFFRTAWKTRTRI